MDRRSAADISVYATNTVDAILAVLRSQENVLPHPADMAALVDEVAQHLLLEAAVRAHRAIAATNPDDPVELIDCIEGLSLRHVTLAIKALSEADEENPRPQ